MPKKILDRLEFLQSYLGIPDPEEVICRALTYWDGAICATMMEKSEIYEHRKDGKEREYDPWKTK